MGALHLCNFAPCHADIDGAAELKPPAGQHNVTVLVDPTAAEPNRCDEMTFVSRREWIRCLDRRQFPTTKMGEKVGRGGIVRRM